MRKCFVIGPITLVLMLLCAGTLRAQPDTSRTQPPAEPKRSPVCWRPQPESHCRSYVVTELELDRPFRSPDGRLGARYGWALGAMMNRGPSDAVGVIASYADGAFRTTPFRVEGRYRRWLTGSTGLDLALGYA